MSDPHPGWMHPSGYPQPKDTNGFSIASLVAALVGTIIWVIGPVLGIVFGVVALKQIPRLGQSGRGLAIAGITIGGILLLVDVIALIALGVDSSSGTATGTV